MSKSGVLGATVALVCAVGTAMAAPQPAGVSYYSAGLSAQLFSDMPAWPASVDQARIIGDKNNRGQTPIFDPQGSSSAP